MVTSTRERRVNQRARALCQASSPYPPVRFRPSLLTPATNMAAAGPSTAPSLAALGDPQPRLVDAAAMDYFLIEAVQTLRHSSAVAEARAKKIEDEMIDAGLIPPPPPPQVKAKKDAQRDSVGTGSSVPNDDEDEGLRARLEAIGLHVGANITERCGDHNFLQRGT
jgi:hypothetical protein